METLSAKRQGYNPHLKKVLKSYQLSAQRSLHGPGQGTLAASVLVSPPAPAGATASAAAPPTDPSEARGPSPPVPAAPPSPPTARAPSPEPSRPSPASSGSGAEPTPAPPSPRPFIHSAPLLSAAERGEDGRAERLDTSLEGELIACFLVGGEKRLCLPEVLQLVLRDFSLSQINSVCDELHIYCSRCDPEQLEELRATGTLPAAAPSCGLITQTDAERLCAALLPRGVAPVKGVSVDGKGEAGGFGVYHECFGRASGVCRPEEPLQRSIECSECRLLFGPQQFVSHAHRQAETSTVHWGFDSANWRAYLLLAEDQQDQAELKRKLNAYKERAEERLKRKQSDRERDHAVSMDVETTAKYAASEDAIHYLKKARLEDGVPVSLPTVTAAPTTYLPYPDPSSYLYWYDTWALSAYRPWPSIFTATKDGKAAPMPLGLPSIPPYIGQGPPVLLQSDSVVSLRAEYERYERSYQPNVALLSVSNQEQAEEKYSHVDVTSTEDEEAPPIANRPPSPGHTVSTITLNPSRRSPSPAPAPRASPSLPHHHLPLGPPLAPICTRPPVPSTVLTSARPPLVKCKSEVEMSSDTEDSASESTGVDNSVAAVLESLSSDEKDARMAKVLRSLVKRLGDVEAERGRLTAENEVLRRRSEEQNALIIEQERVIQRLQEQRERLNSKHDPEAFQDKVMAMEKELRTLRSEVSRLPNGRHDTVNKSEGVSNSKDIEQRVSIRRESVETNNIAVSVIHKSESQALSGTE